ncbi:nucleoid-associated protein [Aerococcaceae bacterium NML180378]|nr:nucleoid-associated protein [Aerococcaceae bacterium NML180378]
MYIQQAILHILDKDSGNLLVSEHVMDLSDVLVREYINKLIKKVSHSDIKAGSLTQEAYIYHYVQNEQHSFIEKSIDLANKIYDIIAPAEEIPAADYVFFEARDDEEAAWFGFIRLDYSSQYTHFLDAQAGITNQLVRHNAIFPSATRKPTEAFLLNVTTGEYQLLEKRYVIEGTKQLYLSEQVLRIEPPEAAPQQIKQIKKVITQVAKQFDEPTYEVLASAQQIIYEQLEEEHVIESEAVLEQVFQHNEAARMTACNLAQERELPSKIAVNNIPKYEKKYSKQKFKLANGIEITIPAELYGNRDVVEFVNNPDGSISVLIKNVEDIKNQFNG